MKKVIFVLILSLILSSCYTNRHIIGDGVQKGRVIESQRQYYALWGALPLNHLYNPLKDKKDYEIITNYNIVGVLIEILTSGIFSARKIQYIE